MLASLAHSDTILFQLFVIFAVAKLSAEIFERLKQPAVVGEILAGVLIGPSVLGWIHPNEITSVLSELGVIFLLFSVGLEINASSLFKVGGRALAVGMGGVLLPFFVGWGLMSFKGEPTIEGVFIGAAMVATSVGITARVLAALGRLSEETSQIIMAAAVIDDILGLLVLSVVSSLAQGEVKIQELFISSGISIAFVLFMILVGTKIVRRSRPALEKLKVGHAFFVVGLILCLGLSYLASIAGVAAIIGAFLAGMALAELGEDTSLHHFSSGVTELLVPFFLVGIGLQLDLQVFKESSVIVLALIVTLLAVITKIVGCGIPALALGKKAALKIGIGMVPRGEVGIIVAQIGLSMGVLTQSLYGVMVFMAVATTLIAPPLLKILFREPSIPTSLEESVLELEQEVSELN
ncbi:MAG: cation:proton antiporter [Deltaproteobacteria bacterium]|nr:cation:proton antiporter [Deltaproteobacteria bacterium]